jgi:predicted alpha-1,2-mannosidase
MSAPRCPLPLRASLALALLLALGTPGCRHVPAPQSGELGRWVDPFIGTGGLPWTSGMLFPGATTPFGLARPSPDTSWPGGLVINSMATAGYFHGHANLFGFSQTRLSGTGVPEGGLFRVTPMVGDEVTPATRRSRPLFFTHSDEVASPGYYAVWLPRPELLVELTATTHVGVHRYTFPARRAANLLLDATSALGNTKAHEGRIEILPEAREVVGEARLLGAFSKRYGGLRGFFVARFNRPFTRVGTWSGGQLEDGRLSTAGDDVGAVLGFGEAGGPVEVAVGLSFVSRENARANLDAELAARDFDAVRAAAREAWEEHLGRLRIESSEPEVARSFYSALYHSMLMPTHFTDVNGEYLGFGGTVGVADGFTYRTDFSLWDTFRTHNPLLTLLAPEVQRDSLKSLVRMGRAGGGLPRWPSGAGDAGSMIGTPSDLVIAESVLKGLGDFEVEEAYAFMKKSALAPPPPGTHGRDGLEDCLALGWCPADRMPQAVSRTLEYAWADASLANLAQRLGHSGDEALFRERALAYRNTWNPATRFFQPRNADGSFQEPFYPDLLTFIDKPLFKGRYLDDYVEGSPRQWRWMAPHDPAGLIQLFGGPRTFVEELETFLANASPGRGAVSPGANYWHGNQHDIHALFLFNDAGRPDLTQKWVRWALTTRYGTGPDGLDGNDDGGTLSAWYVLAGGLGLYPVAGSDRYWIGAPIVERATLSLPGGATLAVVAENQALKHPYVQQVSLNGVRLCEPSLRHAALAGGGTLHFQMGPRPAPGGGFACP